MSRLPRAGTPGKLVGIRATDTERAAWERCAKGAGQSLSEWLRSLANNEARETAIRGLNRAVARDRALAGHRHGRSRRRHSRGDRRGAAPVRG